MRQQRFIKKLCSLGMLLFLAASHTLWAQGDTKKKSKQTAKSAPTATRQKPKATTRSSKTPGTKQHPSGRKKKARAESEKPPSASASEEAPSLAQPVCEETEPTTEATPESTAACEKDPRALVLTHYALHETYCLRPRASTPFFSCQQQQDMRHILRCHHTKEEGRLDPNLVQLLYNAVTHIPNSVAKPLHITIIAGYRALDVAKSKGNPNSAHTQGRAVDFFIDGVDALTLFDWLRGHLSEIEWTHEKHAGIEVIYYPHQDRAFVHLAIHRDNTNWIKIDDSKPGQDLPQRDPPPLPTATSSSLRATTP